MRTRREALGTGPAICVFLGEAIETGCALGGQLHEGTLSAVIAAQPLVPAWEQHTRELTTLPRPGLVAAQHLTRRGLV